jgi:hypothetical protein
MAPGLLIDYVSLFKTRVILAVLKRLRRQVLAVAIVVVDYVVYRLIFAIGAILMFSVIAPVYPVFHLGWSFYQILEVHMSGLYVSGDVLPIFFWAGLAPSLWMWLYVLALFVTRGLLRSERILIWLRWALDIEKNPFRSIGAVAATLAFIASVAVILVSAEVSRISAAS